MAHKKSSMRKWQQDLVQDIQEPEITVEIPEKIPEKTEIVISESQVCGLVFLLSCVILIVLKPPLVTLRYKDRPEESPSLNWTAVLVLSLCVTGAYWGLQNKIF